MILEVKRRIRDNLHGSIDLTVLEDEVVTHPYFQRLRRIKQTAFLSMVFPGAAHTRFEHSLGTMYLASKAWMHITSNQKRLEKHKKRPIHAIRYERCLSDDYEKLLRPTFSLLNKVCASKYSLQVLRLAALLHDVGHPPLSHTGEVFFPSYDEVLENNKNLSEYLKKYIIEIVKDKNKSQKITHELISVIAIDKILHDIYQFNKQSVMKIWSQDIASILIPEIPPRSNSELQILKLEKLFHELVSGEVDIDRMDYLLRDSRECGVAYGLFDIDRIMDSLTYYLSPMDSSYHLAIKLSGLSAFEDYLRARQSMYLQLYFHKTSIACEAMLKYISRFLMDFSLPSNLEKYMEIDDYQIVILLQEKINKLETNDKLKTKLQRILKNLFLNRNLWKCIYEVSSSSKIKPTSLDIKKTEQKLVNNKEDYEIISTSNYLCGYIKDSANKTNFLRLIRKNDEQSYEVAKINDFSRIYHDNSIIKIDRIYKPF